MSSTRTRAEFEKEEEEEEEEEAFVLVVVVLVLRAAKSALLFPLVRFHFGTFLCAWIVVVDVPVRRAARVVVVIIIIVVVVVVIVSRAARILPSLFLLPLSLSFQVQN